MNKRKECETVLDESFFYNPCFKKQTSTSMMTNGSKVGPLRGIEVAIFNDVRLNGAPFYDFFALQERNTKNIQVTILNDVCLNGAPDSDTSLTLALSCPCDNSVPSTSKQSDSEGFQPGNNLDSSGYSDGSTCWTNYGARLYDTSLTLALSCPCDNGVPSTSKLSDNEGFQLANNLDNETVLDVMPLKVYFPVGDIEWKIKKVLKKSDCDEQHRLLMSRKSVASYVLVYLDEASRRQVDSSRGLRVGVLDCDKGICIGLTLKRWPSSGSIALMDNWKRDFVVRRGLNEGDEVGLCWDEHQKRFLFSVLRRSPRLDC